MTRAKRGDDRLLSKEEQHLIAQTRHPVVKTLAGHELLKIVKRLRECRDRAREVGKFKRLELRGQATLLGINVASRSATLESDGHRAKRTLLAAALKRANKETERRRVASARDDLASNAKNALAMSQVANNNLRSPPVIRTANKGMLPKPKLDARASDNLKRGGERPALERSRKVR